jgi:hypothetical protein
VFFFHEAEGPDFIELQIMTKDFAHSAVHEVLAALASEVE